jgi:hypothetical protein
MNTTVIEMETGAIAAVAKLPPDEARTKRRADAFLALATNMEVKTLEDYDLAATELRAIIAAHSALEAERVGFTQPLNDVLTKINAKFQPYLKALRGDGKKDTVHAEGILKGKMAAFLTEQQRLADVARREAEALAQAERDRLEAEARALREKAEAEAREAARIEAERVTKAAAAQKLIDDAAAELKGKARKAAEEQARVLREAEEARQAEANRIAAEQAEQREREAQALETTAAVTIAQPVVVAVQKGRGISTPKAVEFELLSLLDLVKHIGEKRNDLVVLLDLNETKMRALVKMMGMGTDLPGVRVFEKTGITVR